jgi:hypothetical protein
MAALIAQKELIHHQRAELCKEGMPWIAQVVVPGLKAAQEIGLAVRTHATTKDRI